ncbi:serine hydrolase [Streptomyces ferrugineus]|uniref:Serine hydrolase n=1 Tax=Streptomyces ferrugineus TaxID=1413221 RepID=A0A7M2SPL5_9ACTN|nr:serine hydrolase [Streptomyces ferrugineus]QOV38192.1 serine hydrolase [Streptomyces ferrugineus]
MRYVRALVAAGVLIASSVEVAAAPAPAPSTVSCTSAEDGLADRLKKDITAVLARREGAVAVGVHDRATSTTCTLWPTAAFDSASVVKVTVLAALLWDAGRQDRRLTRREAALGKAMIVKSDNAATRTLWKQLGMKKIKGFLAAADMTRTVTDRNGHWGLTQITVTDEQKLLSLITGENAVLSADSRAHIRGLMGQVVPSQRWGTPYGVPSGVSVAVKNGWLSRATHGWRVHSVGAFKGRGHDYTITVLTQDNSTMKYGIATIQGVAEVVHRDLAAG